MGSDNPPPPTGRLKARNKAQLVRAFVVTCAIILLLYLTSEGADDLSDPAFALGPMPDLPAPAKITAKGAKIDAGGDFPTRTYPRSNSLKRRENWDVAGGSVESKRDSVAKEEKPKEPREDPKPLPVTPKPTFSGLFQYTAVDIKARRRCLIGLSLALRVLPL